MAIIKSPKVISTILGLRNLSAIPRGIPDLSDYTKHTLPWKTGTTGNIYVYTNPKSNTVYIGSDENQELTERSQVIRFRTTTPGVTTGAQAVAELNVIQSEAVYSYELVVNVPTKKFLASGGTTQVSSTLKTYRNDVLISTGAVNPTFKLHGGDEGKGITVSSTGLVTAADRGTTVGDERVVHIQASTKDTYTKEEVQVSFQVTQQANQISYDNPVVNLTVPLVPAKGGSVSSGTVSYTQKVKYTSGASQSLNSGGQVTYSRAVSGSNLGITEKSQTKLGTLTATVSMNGKSGSATMVVFQQANVATYGPVTAGNISVSADIPASGGSRTATLTAGSQTVTYTSEATRAGKVTSSQSAAISGSNLGVTAKVRSKVGSITGTWTGEGSKSATKSVDVYQALNRIENSNYQPSISSYGTPTVSIGNGLTAAGGSATVTASVTDTESYKQLYTSGSTTSHTRSKAGSVTLSMTGNGNSRFSFTSPTISHSSMTTNLTTDTVTITATNAGSTSKTTTASKSITNTRKPKSTSGGGITYENVVIGTITNAVIPASGGTAVAKAGNGTQKWTKAAGQTTYIYDSGSEKTETTTASTSGTDQVTPSISELSGTASSKGTTVSGVTTVKSSTVTWTGGGDKSASGTMTVTQAANAVVNTTSSNGEWTGTLSTNKTTAAASADSINVTFGAIKRTITYTDTYTSTATANRTATDYYSGTAYVKVTTEKDGAKVSDWSPTSLSYTNSSSTTTKTISKASYGTTLRNAGSVDFDLYAGDAYVRVYQRISVAANTVSYSTPSVTNNYPESAAAGDYWSTRAAYSQTATYTSGSTTNISSGGAITYAVGTPATGWTLETSTGKITVDNNKSTSKRTATNFVKTTVVLNGKTGTCYSSPVQAAGAKQYGSWSVSISANTTSISAAGGSATISSSASRPWTWNGVSGSGGTETDTPALSLVTANGSSLRGSTLTFPSRGTTEGSARSATVRATYSGITKDVTVTQAANTKSVSQGTPSISLSANTQTIAYSGGSSTITYSASRTDTYTYTSGSKTTTPVSLTSSVSISGSSTGFTISGTTAGTRTVTATENIGVLDRSITVTASLSGASSKTVTITQGTGPYIKAKYGEVVQMYRGEVSSQIKDIVGAWKQ